MVYSAFGEECLLPQLCHPQTDSSIEVYRCCCSEQQQQHGKILVSRNLSCFTASANSLVYDTLVYYQAKMFDNVFCLLVPSTVFTALHMCGFTSVCPIMSFLHTGSEEDAGTILSTNEKSQ